MKFVLLIFHFNLLSVYNYDIKTNEDNGSAKLVFNIYRKNIHILKLEKLNSTSGISFRDTDVLVNTSGVKSYIGQIDYSLNANIYIWRVIEPENAFCVLPIDKRFV